MTRAWWPGSVFALLIGSGVSWWALAQLHDTPVLSFLIGLVAIVISLAPVLLIDAPEEARP